MSGLVVIGAALAAYRLAYLVARERGPLDLMTTFRSMVLRLVGLNSQHWLYEGITCMACLSFWFALGMLALALWGGPVGAFLLTWWGIAGGVLVLMQTIDALGARHDA